MTGRQFRVRGLVQGVGFRPYVWRLAGELGLAGWVRNDGAGVTLTVDGEKVAEFRRRLPLEIPPLARIDGIDESPAEDAVSGEFRILDSLPGQVATAIGPDAALCPACLAELCDPADRRWRYAFTTCTHCGPRYTVSAGLPYDRARTSLAVFPLCPACAAEYENPTDRRFHAETTCCPDCGPHLKLSDAFGQDLTVDREIDQKSASVGVTIAANADGDATLPDDPIAATLALLRAGRIVAIKGLGGFHLACDAQNAAAVAELRRRKQREAKPFAVMGLNVASLADYAHIDAAAAELLASPAAPIVLCPKAGHDLPEVAPNLAELGVMLPATPLHLLLWHEAAGRPAGTDWAHQKSDLLLVMTSANPHGEPLVRDDAEALARLGGTAAGDGPIADAILGHDRAIVVRADDSVLRATTHGPTFVRRARGYVPLPIALAKGGPSVLALGGHLKNTVCVLRGNEAFLSQHVGSLDNAAAIGFLDETVRHLLDILDVRPDLIAHDLHPDYASSQLARRLAEELGVPAYAVPHHQAHVAAVVAEHGLRGPVVGFALDGVGLGPDGGAWGGELLLLDRARCTRLGHLQPLRLPGGDRAAREPWRLAVAALHQAGLAHHVGGWLQRRWPQRDAGQILTLLARDLRCPPTSSLGRWFDAVAALLGVRDESRYEGQAAMELEALATQYIAAHGRPAPLSGGWTVRWENEVSVLDLSPLLPALLEAEPGYGAALFHATLAAALADWLNLTVDGQKEAKIAVDRVILSGGCALNALLADALRGHLAAAGSELLEARRAPPNDGGLALGQAWVARQMFKEMKDVSGHTGASR